MTQVLDSLERMQMHIEKSSQARDARLDTAVAAITASTDKLRRVWPSSARSEVCDRGMSKPLYPLP